MCKAQKTKAFCRDQCYRHCQKLCQNYFDFDLPIIVIEKREKDILTIFVSPEMTASKRNGNNNQISKIKFLALLDWFYGCLSVKI